MNKKNPQKNPNPSRFTRSGISHMLLAETNVQWSSSNLSKEHLRARNPVNDITHNLSDLTAESSGPQKSSLLCPKRDGWNRWG